MSDEYWLDTPMTKFPGGGLEYGEGTADCLKREALEEFGQEIEITGHYYTTDFFQKALFFENTQLLSIYYTFRFIDEIKFEMIGEKYDFSKEGKNGMQFFRWQNLKTLNPDEFTFPIDKFVAKKIITDFENNIL